MKTARVVMQLALAGVVIPTAAADEPSGRFVLGAGFSSDEGFLASAEVANDDLFGSGQALSLTASMSARRQMFLLRHDVPDVLGSGFDLRTELFDTRRQLPGFERRGSGGAITLSHALGPSTRGYLRYRVEEVGVTFDGIARATAVGLGEGRFATLRAGVVHDTLDARFAPTRGTRYELWGEVADRGLGSEHDLMRIGGSFDHARDLGRFTLRLHGDGTHVRSREPGGVPLSQRLYHDGHGELSGYPFGSITDGATFEARGRVELELPVWRAAGLSIATFAEAGVRDTSMYPAVGVSILWRSPIGPLRFDWAIPLDRGGGGPAVFSFGAGF